MKFFALLSVLFYDNGVVAVLYALSGHSLMLPDRATAHRATAETTRRSNIQCERPAFKVPGQCPKASIFRGMGKYLKQILQQLTWRIHKQNGTVTVRHLADTPDSQAWCFQM